MPGITYVVNVSINVLPAIAALDRAFPLADESEVDSVLANIEVEELERLNASGNP